MEDLSFTKILELIASKAVLMTLLPSLFLNVVIDSTKHLDAFTLTNKAGRIIVLNGLLSLLGLGFGLIYYFLLKLSLDECVLHSLAIVGLSYLFYQIKIYDLIKKKINDRLESTKNE